MIIRTFDGSFMFRVYRDPEHFTDYEIRHDDLSVTIDADALAAFYKIGERNILDHSPPVLGLKKIGNQRAEGEKRTQCKPLHPPNA